MDGSCDATRKWLGYSTYEDLHRRFTGTHLVYQRRERLNGICSRLPLDHIIRAEMNHHDIGLGGAEPSRELVVGDNACGLESGVTFILAVVWEAAIGCFVGADEVGVLDVVGLELLPEYGAPTTLGKLES